MTLLTRLQLQEKATGLEWAEVASLATHKSNQEASRLLSQELEASRQSNTALQSANENLESKGRILQLDYEALEGQLGGALQEVKDAKQVGEELQKAKALCEAANQEIEQLRGTRIQLAELNQKHSSLENDMHSKSTELVSLRNKLVDAAKYPSIIEEKDKRLRTADADNKALRETLGETRAKAAEVDDLQTRVLSKDASIEQLQQEVAAGRQYYQELQKVSSEKEALTQDLTKARSDLEATTQQVQQAADLEKRLEEKEEEVVRLRPQAAQTEELLQKFQQMDSRMASLRTELDRVKTESQESAASHTIQNGTQLADLDGFVSQQSYISFFQPSQTQIQDGSRAQVMDQPGTHLDQRPQRRVADRSSTVQRPLPLPQHVSQSNLAACRPQSTNSVDVIPDSQLDVHLKEALGMHGPYRGDHRDSSPLSSVEGYNENDAAGAIEDDVASQPEIPETLQDPFRPPQQAQSFQILNSNLPDRDTHNGRPSSSATSVDLFKQHENNLEAATQLTSRSPERAQAIRGHGHPKPTPPSLAPPRNPHFRSPGCVASSNTSPKHLRSGTQFRERFTTPAPETGSSPQQTPTTQRERYQPNSAAKRSAEGDGPPAKRLERHPERLAVRNPSKYTSHLGSEASQSTINAGQRKGGSVVGTPAPVPGKSKKSSRAPRKDPRKDKYTARFSQDS